MGPNSSAVMLWGLLGMAGVASPFSVAQTFLSAVAQAFQPADRSNATRGIPQSGPTADRNVGDTADWKVCATTATARGDAVPTPPASSAVSPLTPPPPLREF